MVELARTSFATCEWAAQWGVCWMEKQVRTSEFVMLVKKVLGMFSLPWCRVSHFVAWATHRRMCLRKGPHGHHHKKVCVLPGGLLPGSCLEKCVPVTSLPPSSPMPSLFLGLCCTYPPFPPLPCHWQCILPCSSLSCHPLHEIPMRHNMTP